MGAHRRRHPVAANQGRSRFIGHPVHPPQAVDGCTLMRPLAELPVAGIRGLFFDIDDTLTTDGRLTAAAYGALERWKAAGKWAVPVTGRPAGWCDHIARMWPVDAV